MNINDIPLGRLKEILASDVPLTIVTTEALIARLESSGMMLNIMRRQRDGYQAQARKAEQAVARVREVCESDGYEVSNEFGTWDTVAVENIIDALDGEQS